RPGCTDTHASQGSNPHSAIRLTNHPATTNAAGSPATFDHESRDTWNILNSPPASWNSAWRQSWGDELPMAGHLRTRPPRPNFILFGGMLIFGLAMVGFAGYSMREDGL